MRPSRSTRIALGIRLYLRGLWLAFLLRIWPVQRVVDHVRGWKGPVLSRASSSSPQELALLTDQLIRRWTLPFSGRCLVRSLLLFAVLRRGVPEVGLVVGLDADQGPEPSVAGHAWITVDGRPLFERDNAAAANFTPVITVGGADDETPGAVRALP